MRILKIIIFSLIVVAAGVQLIPAATNKLEVVKEKDFNVIYETSSNIKSLLIQSCYDCHSNVTNYPWYSKLQPVRMLMDHHIEAGKEELNFSAFGNYSDRKKRNKIEAIINQIEAGKMPISSYVAIQSEAKLNNQERSELLKFLRQLKKK